MSTAMARAQAVEKGAHWDEINKDLTALHQAMTRYLEAHGGVWPQMPKNVLESTDENVIWAWYIEMLKRHGATDEDLKLSSDSGTRPMSYTITDFTEEPMMAYRWRAQPWFLQLVPLKPMYMIGAEGRTLRCKGIDELQKLEGEPNSYIDPELLGLCPIEAVPAKLRPLFETASKGWKDKP